MLELHSKIRKYCEKLSEDNFSVPGVVALMWADEVEQLQSTLTDRDAEIAELNKTIKQYENGFPKSCPITGRPFWGSLITPGGESIVPTYGSPFDTYTIPEKDEDGNYYSNHYDHDDGSWKGTMEGIDFVPDMELCLKMVVDVDQLSRSEEAKVVSKIEIDRIVNCYNPVLVREYVELLIARLGGKVEE